MANGRDIFSKAWCFTSFAQNEPEYKNFRMEYLVYGREVCPDTGRPHFQGFVVFKTRTRFSSVQRCFPGSHIEKCRGSTDEAADYCQKDGDFKEFGKRPPVHARTDKFQAALRLAEAGKLEEVKNTFSALYTRYSQFYKSSIKVCIDELDDACGVWIYGPPRSGKDYGVRTMAKELGKSLYLKNCNKWWDGYKNEEIVLLSDVEPSHQFLGYFLKIWADRYAFNAEIKGGTLMIRPKQFFVTSNFSISECFQGEVLRAIEARFDLFSLIDGSYLEVKSRPIIKASRRFADALVKKYKPVDDVVPEISLPGPSKAPTKAEKELFEAAWAEGFNSEDDFC